ncbi:aminopeptidase P family protein [Candidatus Woesearchaeota archaeon]|nr:aminopeptidase P family protein [Candidatus Woesearchaeota archaeon]
MRIKKLQKAMNKNKIGLSLIFSLDEKPNTNMIYFTGYSGIGILAVLKRSAFLLVPEMEYEKATKSGLNVHKAEKKRKMLETLAYLLKKKKIAKIGTEEGNITVRIYKRLRRKIKGRYVDLSKILSAIRMIKEKEELDCIRKACNVTDNIFSKLCRNFKFKTEPELNSFIEEEIRKAGCELAFPPIVASGEGTSQPHYVPAGNIKNGFLMLDFGARYNGYCSDMTRMLYVGKPTKKELDDYNLILETITKCEKAALQKKKFSELYNLSIEILGDKAELFIHALGHGLGLDIHESPSLYSEDKTQIQENVAFTIEPGIYMPGEYGIRIEDTMVIRKGKLEVLTKSSKGLKVIKR